jgi:hypothetical protein
MEGWDMTSQGRGIDRGLGLVGNGGEKAGHCGESGNRAALGALLY